MVLVDFYEVVEVSKTGKTAKVRELAQRPVSSEDSGGNVKVVPIPGDFRGDAKTRRIQAAPKSGKPYFRADYGTAVLWDGQPATENRYD